MPLHRCRNRSVRGSFCALRRNSGRGSQRRHGKESKLLRPWPIDTLPNVRSPPHTSACARAYAYAYAYAHAYAYPPASAIRHGDPRTYIHANTRAIANCIARTVRYT